MGPAVVVYITQWTTTKNRWHIAFCYNMGGTEECCAKWNKSRERQITGDLTHI